MDTARTKAYYQSLSENDLCGCNYCRNFRRHIKASYPKLSRWFNSRGIDIEKAMETSPLEADDQGYIEYAGCQYVAFGSCEPDFEHRVENVTIRRALSYPDTGIPEPHFVLESFPIRLPADKDLL